MSDTEPDSIRRVQPDPRPQIHTPPIGTVAYRCSLCGITWPDETAFVICSLCGTPTWRHDMAVFNPRDRYMAEFYRAEFQEHLSEFGLDQLPVLDHEPERRWTEPVTSSAEPGPEPEPPTPCRNFGRMGGWLIP